MDQSNTAFVSHQNPQAFVDSCEERQLAGYTIQSSGVTHDSYGQVRFLWAVLVK